MDVSTTGLRVLREIAERGTFTAAAAELGYTQSAVSRQVAALEREVGSELFERRPGRPVLTSAGTTMLRHARAALAELDAARRELSGADERVREVRVGVYVSAGAVVLPRVVAVLRRTRPEIRILSRDGTTPALVRSLRAGSLDLAVITARPPFRAPDAELPRLTIDTVAESELLVAVPALGRFAGRTSVTVAELATAEWISSPANGAEPLLGVWPGLPGRPRVAHAARDWLTKLSLVAAGCGVTTVPTNFAAVLPNGVAAVRVADAPPEVRRMLLARLPGRLDPSLAAVIAAVREVHSG